ncbi:hypothetical protein [Nesterenkonia halobia]|uniref:Uncharacterized protein n=1 Tax=Nesterenkonia halobia TaxID=37922 RepID=A0ABP6REU5_9MICC
MSSGSDAAATRRTAHWWFLAAAGVVVLGPWILGLGDPELPLQLVCLGAGIVLLGVGGFLRRREGEAARGRR